MDNNQDEKKEKPGERLAESEAKGYSKDVVLAGETPDLGTNENTTLPQGKESTVVRDDSQGEYVGPDGADGSGGDDETFARITGRNVIP